MPFSFKKKTTTIYSWSLEDAYDLVQHCNASIAPNFHFMGQLTDYERHLGLRSQGQGVGIILEGKKTP